MADRSIVAYRSAAAIARTLPLPVLDVLARGTGVAMARVDRSRREQVERNLRRVYGPSFGGWEMRRAVARTFGSYAQYWAEAFRLPTTSPAELSSRMTTDGWERITDALAEGKGAICATLHLGAWDWGGCWAAASQPRPVSVVVEALEPPELFEFFVELRRELGLRVIPLGPQAGADVIRALKDNHIVCLLCDRDIGGGGVEVEFFGERTKLPGGPATLALRTGAPILPTAVLFDGESHHGVVRPAVPVEREGRLRDDVQRITQLIAYELEALIRLAPEQWHVMQPNWPSDPGYGGAAAGAAVP